MWRNSLNEAIKKIDAAIETVEFDDYTKAVDLLCDSAYAGAEEDIGEAAAMLLLLKISNLLVAKYEFFHRHTTLISHPLGLLIDPSNACALRCPGCVHSGLQSTWDWPSGLLSDDVFTAFLDEHGPFAFDVYLANYGEPLLNPMTPKFIRYARRFGLPTFTSTSLSVPPRLTEGLVESGLNFLILSIDGASDETYSIYRRRGNFHQVMENLKRLVETKRRLGSYSPVLNWQFLVFEHNFHEIETVKAMAERIGVNQLSLAQPFAVDWDDPSIKVKQDWHTTVITFDNDEAAYRTHLGRMRWKLASDKIARHFTTTWNDRRLAASSNGPLRPPFGHPGRLVKQCEWLYKSLSLDANGRVMPCARPPAKTGDLNFSRRDVENHFNSRRHRLARMLSVNRKAYEAELAEQPEAPPYCQNCEHRDTKADIDTRFVVRRLLYDFDLYEAITPACKDALTDW